MLYVEGHLKVSREERFHHHQRLLELPGRLCCVRVEIGGSRTDRTFRAPSDDINSLCMLCQCRKICEFALVAVFLLLPNLLRVNTS